VTSGWSGGGRCLVSHISIPSPPNAGNNHTGRPNFRHSCIACTSMAAVLRRLPLRAWFGAAFLRPIGAARLSTHAPPQRTSFRSFASASRRMPAVRQTIVPTEQEERIFKTLEAASKKLDDSVKLRCAGGWVRDKLLGHDSDSPDIDIALDTCTGAAFGTALQAHLEQAHDEISRSVVIESNPEQSKHLETARITVRRRRHCQMHVQPEIIASNVALIRDQGPTCWMDTLWRSFAACTAVHAAGVCGSSFRCMWRAVAVEEGLHPVLVLA